MAHKMKKPKKKDTPPMTKAGPNMMPHTGKKDCRCPSCQDKRRK